jgi:2-polyprenyl-3-methyl-5-hydroxy-6-metoxy-1,4-benzoquinol methylase
MKKDPTARKKLGAKMDGYNRAFYAFVHATAVTAAAAVVPQLLTLLQIKSVVDVGCGDGTWLDAFRQRGVSHTVGIDGNHIERDLLKIPVDQFHPMNLERPRRWKERFDLVLSLEVAEHLRASAAKRFVSFLAGLGDVVCFSAAVPGQSGHNHINEQWPDYWANLFRAHGFIKIDCLRAGTWDDQRVAWYYAQNMFIFARPRAIRRNHRLDRAQLHPAPWPERLIHPRGFSRHLFLGEERVEMLAEAAQVLFNLGRGQQLLLVGFRNERPFERLGALETRILVRPGMADSWDKFRWMTEIDKGLRSATHVVAYLPHALPLAKGSPLHRSMNRRFKLVMQTNKVIVWTARTHATPPAARRRLS